MDSNYTAADAKNQVLTARIGTTIDVILASVAESAKKGHTNTSIHGVHTKNADFVLVARELNRRGFVVNLDILGKDVPESLFISW